MARRVWPYELFNFIRRDRQLKHGPIVAEFCGASQAREEESMVVVPAAPVRKDREAA
jgi:hypothetical protein